MPEKPRPRVLTVDFWRGVALLTIFINHVPGNVFENFTHRNFGFSDATEVFVLLAGVAAGLAYLSKFEQPLQASVRVGLRAVQLYVAHLFLIVACAALIAYCVTLTDDDTLFVSLHLDVLINQTIEGLIGMVTLGLQPGYLNILPLYIVLLLLAPLFLMLVRRSPALALLLSAALYVATQLLPLRLPNYPGEGTWFFNPFAWQLLFVIGMVIGRSLKQGVAFRHRRALTLLSAVYLLISLVWVQSGFFPWWNLEPLPAFLWAFSKTDLHLPRLLHLAALAYLVTQIPIERWLRNNAAAERIMVVGRHALPVFCAGTVLAIAAQAIRAQMTPAFSLDLLLIGSGIALQIMLARLLEWNRGAVKVTA